MERTNDRAKKVERYVTMLTQPLLFPYFGTGLINWLMCGFQ